MYAAGRTLRYASSVARCAFSHSSIPEITFARVQPPVKLRQAFQQTFVRCIQRGRSHEPKITEEDGEVVDSKTNEVYSDKGGDREVKRWRKDPWKIKRQHYTRHVLNLSKKDKLDEAAVVFEHMINAGVYPDAAAYNVLIAGYGRSGNVKEAFHLFNEMKKRALQPTNHTYSSLLNACANAGPSAKEYLLKIQDEMERRNVTLNGIATNAHLAAMASCNLHDEAFETYGKMSSHRLIPDLRTFGTLLMAASKDVQSGLEKAQKVWSELTARGGDLAPDVLCYNLLLSCMRDAGIPSSMRKPLPQKQGEEGAKEPERRKMVSSPPRGAPGAEVKETVTFTLPPGHKVRLCVGSNWGERWLTNEDTLSFLAAMKKAGLAPDVKTFNLLIGLALDTECVLKAMEEANVPPDRKFWIATIRSLALRGDLRGAKAILTQQELHHDQQAYQAVAMGCVSMEDGLKLVEEMEANGVRPNEFVLGTLVGNAAKHREYEYLTALLKVMKHKEVIPNTTILQMLERAANNAPSSPWQLKKHQGFKGYYTIWRTTMSPE